MKPKRKSFTSLTAAQNPVKPTPEQISNLPKRVQKHIANIERERSVCVRELNKFMDGQTESPFRYWAACGQTSKTRFIQTRKIEVHWAGVELTVLVRPDRRELDLQWCATDGRVSEIAFIPISFGSARLKNKENMR